METQLQKARRHVATDGAFGPRRMVALFICALGALALLAGLMEQMMRAAPNLRGALVGGGTAAAATALGTLPVLFSQRFSKRTFDCFLGFGAGVMLGATAFSLIVPALAAAESAGAGNWGACAWAPA